MDQRQLQTAMVDQQHGQQQSDHPPPQLEVETTTWGRDSHELFDYETRVVAKKSFSIRKNNKVFRQGTEVSMEADGAPYPVSADYLLSVRYQNGDYTVYPADRTLTGGPESQLQPRKLWLIVKELKEKQHQLQVGDIIKLGRFKLRVKQLVKSGDAVPEIRLDDQEPPSYTITQQDAENMQCRICLLEGYGSEDDPLIWPCKCKGSIKYIHVGCLKHWINVHGRLNITDDPRVSFFYKQLTCELCKTGFPSAVEINNERILIVNVPRAEAPFIVLECLGSNNTLKGVHVMSMAEKKELKLGRGHESDVRIADVSISRCHAVIRFSRDNFVLEDNNSKFGTLVALKRAMRVPRQATEKLSVQVGRTVLYFSVADPNRQIETKEEEVSASSADGEKTLNTDGNTDNQDTLGNGINRLAQQYTCTMGQKDGSGGNGCAMASLRLANFQMLPDQPHNSCLPMPISTSQFQASPQMQNSLGLQGNHFSTHAGMYQGGSTVMAPLGGGQMVSTTPRAGKGIRTNSIGGSDMPLNASSRGAVPTSHQVQQHNGVAAGGGVSCPLVGSLAMRNCILSSDGSILYQHPSSSQTGVCNNVGDAGVNFPHSTMYNSVLSGPVPSSMALLVNPPGQGYSPSQNMGPIMSPSCPAEWVPQLAQNSTGATTSPAGSQHTQRFLSPGACRSGSMSQNGAHGKNGLSASTSPPPSSGNSTYGSGSLSNHEPLRLGNGFGACRNSIAEIRSVTPPQSLQYRAVDVGTGQPSGATSSQSIFSSKIAGSSGHGSAGGGPFVSPHGTGGPHVNGHISRSVGNNARQVVRLSEQQ